MIRTSFHVLDRAMRGHVKSAHRWAVLQYMFALQLHVLCFHDDVTMEKQTDDRRFRGDFR